MIILKALRNIIERGHYQSMTFPGTCSPLKRSADTPEVLQVPLARVFELIKDTAPDTVAYVKRVIAELMLSERDFIAGGFARKFVCGEDLTTGDIDVYYDSILRNSVNDDGHSFVPDDVAIAGYPQFYNSLCDFDIERRDVLMRNAVRLNRKRRLYDSDRSYTANRTLLGQPIQIICASKANCATKRKPLRTYNFSSFVPYVFVNYDFTCVCLAISPKYLYFTVQAVDDNVEKVLDVNRLKRGYDVLDKPLWDLINQEADHEYTGMMPRMEYGLHHDIKPERIFKYLGYGYNPTVSVMSHMIPYIDRLSWREGEGYTYSKRSQWTLSPVREY